MESTIWICFFFLNRSIRMYIGWIFRVFKRNWLSFQWMDDWHRDVKTCLSDYHRDLLCFFFLFKSIWRVRMIDCSIWFLFCFYSVNSYFFRGSDALSARVFNSIAEYPAQDFIKFNCLNHGERFESFKLPNLCVFCGRLQRHLCFHSRVLSHKLCRQSKYHRPTFTINW